jgi:hypothetical protein
MDSQLRCQFLDNGYFYPWATADCSFQPTSDSIPVPAAGLFSMKFLFRWSTHIHTVLHSNSFHSLPFDHALRDTFVYLLLFSLTIFLFSCFPDTRYSNNRFLQHWKVQKAILTINLQRPIILFHQQQNEGPCVLVTSGWSRWLLYYFISQQCHLATEEMHLYILHSNLLQKWKQCVK